MENIQESMLEVYLFETNSLIEQLDGIMLNAEKAKNFSPEDVNEIFRIMHTVKGSSAMMQYNSLMTVSHRIEDLFYYIRENGIEESHRAELFDLMFMSNDFLKEQVGKIQAGIALSDNVDDFIQKINGFLSKVKGATAEVSAKTGAAKTDASKTGAATGAAAPAAAPAAGSAPVKKAASAFEGYAYGVKIYFDSEVGMENLRAYILLNSIREVCADIKWTPEDVETNPETSASIIDTGFTVYFRDEHEMENAVSVIKSSLNIKSYEVEDYSAPAPEKPAAPAAAASAGPAAAPAAKTAPPPAATSQPQGKQSLISVSLAKLDKLMEVVGEIVITEAMITSSPDLQGLRLDNFTKSARQLRKLTDELQDIVMSTRLVPVSSVFQKMHRIVRDMCQKLGKEVKLTVTGEDTEVDKAIVDSIGDPIMHLVRNAMDHGIEEHPGERVARGKPREGEIRLSAQNAGSEVIITVTDDGRGVDTDRVFAKAKRNGILTKPDNEYTKKEILMLLTAPGFSTNENVTEFSGRGVGMDVVVKNVQQVGGSVSIASEPGEGMEVTFKIPLTLAIVDGMEVALGKEVFTIPVLNINTCFKIEPGEVVMEPGGGENVHRMGQYMPIIKLGELFGIEPRARKFEDGVFIMAETAEQSFCLFVDELLGEQQVVVKPIPSYLNKFNLKNSGIAGCTILGNGNISVIIDMANIYSGYQQKRKYKK